MFSTEKNNRLKIKKNATKPATKPVIRLVITTATGPVTTLVTSTATKSEIMPGTSIATKSEIMPGTTIATTLMTMIVKANVIEARNHLNDGFSFQIFFRDTRHLDLT